MFVFSFVACFVLLQIISFMAPVFAWLTIIGTFVCLGGFSTWATFGIYKDKYDEPHSAQTYLRIAGVVGYVLTFVYAILVCCFCKSLRIAYAILDAAADFVTSTT